MIVTLSSVVLIYEVGSSVGESEGRRGSLRAPAPFLACCCSGWRRGGVGKTWPTLQTGTLRPSQSAPWVAGAP